MGILPGVLLALSFVMVIVIACLINPGIAGRPQPLASWSQRRRRLGDLLPPLLIFLLVMGSIDLGHATPTQAAGVGVVAALGLTAVYRTLNWPKLREAPLSAVTTTGMTLLVLVAALYLNFILGVLGGPAQTSAFVSSFELQPLVMILLLGCLYLVLGCFLDALAMMNATVPVVMPVVTHLGYDPIWFGIFL